MNVNTKAKNIIKELPTAILRWYPFKANSKILYVGKKDAIFKMLSDCYKEQLSQVSVKGLKGLNNSESPDYIVCIGYLEMLQDIQEFFCKCRELLSPKGTLLLGMNNRLGIRYFCGDKDIYTGQVMDGVDDYSMAYNKPKDTFTGRTYDKSQITAKLQNAGFDNLKFYSVFSGLENPTFIFSDGYTPNEDMSNRHFPTYNSISSLFLEERALYKGLLDNGMFHQMANAFFVECPVMGKLCDALQITSSLDRGKENAIITTIYESGKVCKKAPYKEGEKRLKNLIENGKKLARRGIDVVDAKIVQGTYITPFIEAPTGQVYLEQLLRSDKEKFLEKMDEFRDIIMKSSEIHLGKYKTIAPNKETEKEKKSRLKKEKEDWGIEDIPLLKEGFIDMVPLNSLYANGKFIFFDQEFCVKDLPVDVLVSRLVFTFFSGSADLRKYMDPDVLYKRYNIPNPNTTPGGSKYLKVDFDYFDDVMNRKDLSGYYKEVRSDGNVVAANRQRMNYSVEDYRRLFVDIFDKADSRKLILFGSGVFARRFLALYGDDYEVSAVIDNNEGRWGDKIYPEGYQPSDGKFKGVEIKSPEILKKLRHGEYKIIICIKKYLSVMKQLDAMGIYEYSIFDPGKPYPRKRHPICVDSIENYENSTVDKKGGKKYHVGYIAGVFDLYHIGHLNMFRRAKEMCDYLIVGVVSDEGVRRFKGTEPFVPFDERIEMVRSCRYVDEAVEIPYMFNGTEDAWKMHHFDVQFSGTDYVNDPGFASFKEFLEKHGATLEFFPYTQSTSSTKLKELIDKKLL